MVDLRLAVRCLERLHPPWAGLSAVPAVPYQQHQPYQQLNNDDEEDNNNNDEEDKDDDDEDPDEGEQDSEEED